MDEYISRKKALEEMHKWCDPCGSGIEAILAVPAEDVTKVVYGRWISFLDGDHIMPERYYRCSRCGRVENRRQPYCHCGAKMEVNNVSN